MAKHLREPIQIRNLTLKNRLVRPPMATGKSAPDGAVTEALCRYYEAVSQGGYIGLIILEHSYVDLSGKAGAGQLSLAEDADMAGLKRLTEGIHKNGGRVFAQMNHAGAAAKKAITGCSPMAPSAVRFPRASAEDALPRAMEDKDIARVIELFAQAAARAQAAGFDGVEIHAAHGYLLNQFYSPLTNRRTDAYTGATLAGRILLHCNIIRAVRAAVGPDYPLALRLGACDYMDGGTTIADSVAAAPALTAAGIDLLDISGGLCGYVRPGKEEPGYFGEITRAIRAQVPVPVILTGGVADPADAEALLAAGQADLIGVGRAMLADVAWAERAMR